MSAQVGVERHPDRTPQQRPSSESAARRTTSTPLPLLAAGTAVAALCLVPLCYVLMSSSEVGARAAADFLLRPRIGELLWNTTALLFGGVLVSAAIGLGCAWIVERTDLRARAWWHGVLCAPLAVPAFVNGYGWVSTTHAVQSYGGAVLIVSLSYYPLVYLPAVAALRRLDPGLEEVSESLGNSTFTTFRRVVLPGVSTAVLGGSLLVGMHLLAEYGALQLLNYPTLTTGVLDHYRTAFNGPEAALLAAVLVIYSLVLLALEFLLRRRRVRSRVGAGVNRPARRVVLGRRGPLITAALFGLGSLTLGVPLVSLVRWLIDGSSTTLSVGDLTAAAGTTLSLATVTGVIATLVALPVAWLGVRHRTPLTSLIERSTYTASAMPGIVIALALVTFSIRFLPGLYQTVPVLVAGYVILFLPRALVNVRSSLELAPPVIEDVARSLGCTSVAAAVRVTLPLLVPGLGASAALVSLAVSTELTSTLLLAPIGTSTLSTRFWSEASAVSYGAAAPYALAMIVLSIPATWLLSRITTGTAR